MTMTSQGRDLLFAQEGYRRFPYKDSLGVESIGIGRNLRDVGISVIEAQYLADGDISQAEKELARDLSWYPALDPVRSDCLINLWFNMAGKLLRFHNMLTAMQAGDWDQAATQLINSAADHQEPARIEKLAALIKSGSYT